MVILASEMTPMLRLHAGMFFIAIDIQNRFPDLQENGYDNISRINH